MALGEEERTYMGTKIREGESERHILSFHARTNQEREEEKKLLANS